MSAIVNIKTASDADFVRGFVLGQSFPAYDPARVYETGDKVDFGGRVWNALDDDVIGITPGTNALKWETIARPALDLTGSVLAMMVRRSAAATEALIALKSSDASPMLAIISAVNGAFTLRLPLASLQRMPPGVYEHSLIRTRADGIKETIWRGTLTHAVGPTR